MEQVLRVTVYAAVDGNLPREVARMTMEEWRAGKEIPRESPLAWGAAGSNLIEVAKEALGLVAIVRWRPENLNPNGLVELGERLKTAIRLAGGEA